ncbi:hypothetical protein A8C32_04255 [Flavivirga aquatica]|uniref:Orc1-like AAA ATPase domain-containing protein n=1 Tax=Flavivirga aquatica TaxID=1849968 RepID=A0A1E5TBE2_9FLAO|nr:ATP-binding protein [Flavivirga aquatica]OEK08668.1 hypothetical protein A8C32_04255 [Flavivirga aquatica]
MSKINPFKPNHPVSPSMFVGRIFEINALEKSLFQTKNGYPSNFLITGERGIGKSSLLGVIKPIANGEVTSLNYEVFNFISINLVITPRTTLVVLMQLIEKALKRKLENIEKAKDFLNNTWTFVERIKTLDSKVEKTKSSDRLDLIIDDFVYFLAEICKIITNSENEQEPKDGIVFFIDEADSSSQDLHLGYFFKMVTELLLQHGCCNIMFIVVGLPNVVEKLTLSHESSMRIFNHLVIKELSPEYSCYAVDKGLEIGNKINSKITTITSDAKTLISTLSRGYPRFIQQFSYSAFEFSTNGEISTDDVNKGVFVVGGALDIIGKRYYYRAYNEQIKSDDYREVLSIMAESMNSWVKKSEIHDKFNGADHVVTDALKVLSSKKIILKNPSKNWEYRLQYKGFALWVRLFGEREKLYSTDVSM